MTRPSTTVPDDPRAPQQPRQLDLPFLTDDQAATIDQAREAIDRATGHAIAARRPIEAVELARLGAQLAELLDANAAAVRATRR